MSFEYGVQDGTICEPAQVIMHLPENWTKILLVRTYGLGLADGGAYWDIPTEIIPFDLRIIGSRFVVRAKTRNTADAALHGRKALSTNIEIFDLPDADKDLWPESKSAKQS